MLYMNESLCNMELSPVCLNRTLQYLMFIVRYRMLKSKIYIYISNQFPKKVLIHADTNEIFVAMAQSLFVIGVLGSALGNVERRETSFPNLQQF